MALSAFRDRLEHMEHTRNQRLSLLQAEKESQANKSQELASKLASMGAMEQWCLVLEQKIAAQSFKIWALRSEIERLNAKSQSDWRSDSCRAEEREEQERRGDSSGFCQSIVTGLIFANSVRRVHFNRVNHTKQKFHLSGGKNLYIISSFQRTSIPSTNVEKEPSGSFKMSIL